MNCSKCRKPMLTGNQDGKPVYVCMACGVAIQIPQGGPTTQHSTKSRVQTQEWKSATLPTGAPSHGEVSFSEAWEDFCPSLPFVTEYKFHNFRDWRLDFAWPAAKVSLEMDSSVHRTKGRFETDIPKHNALMAEGWIYFRTTRAMLDKDAERFCRMVSETIMKRLVSSGA